MLHMAGYEVDVVKTKHIGHAKSIMEMLQQLPDILVVAGGDGTASEVVTGLKRKNQEMCPILFLPLGEKNETACSLMQNQIKKKFELVENMSHCMLALVQGRIHRRPLIKYELIENDNSVHSKPTFGIHAFSWGILKDIEVNKEKFWYFGLLSHHVSVIIASLSKKFNENISANIISTPPCHGCNKCEKFPENKYRFSFSKLLNLSLSKQPTYQLKENKLCSTKFFSKMDAKQIDITCKQNSESYSLLNTHIIENISSRYDFLISMMTQNKIHPYTSFESRTIEIIPVESRHQTYYIDGEGYDARHIKISFLANALTYFS